MINRKFIVLLVLKLISDGFALLVVPATSPTRHQFIAGIGVPLNLEHEAITYGWTVKAQYFLPESTAGDLKYVYFPGIFTNYTGAPEKNLVKFAVNTVNQKYENHQYDDFPFPLGGKRKRREILTDKLTGQHYESYNSVAQEVGNEELNDDEFYDDEPDENFDDKFDDEIGLEEGKIPKILNFPMKTTEQLMDTSGTRWLLYDGLGKVLSEKGFEGRHCVLRSICEAAESKFGFHGGLFGQLFHIVLSPSTTEDPIVNKDHYDYLKAEALGEAGEPCDKIFHQCKKSPLDIFSKVYGNDLLNLFK